MLINCDWLPPLEAQAPDEPEEDYENRIYKLFLADFQDNDLLFDSLPIKIRWSPKVNDKIQAFYHVTTWGDDQNNRHVDKARQERIRWIRAFIENADCKPHNCDECEGMKAWSFKFHNKLRIKLLLSEERYIVILEKRADYVLLITAFYLDYSHMLNKQLKEYEKAKGAST